MRIFAVKYNSPMQLDTLKHLVEARLGYTPKTPMALNQLGLLIRTTTGESISLSTLKRLWGYVPSKHIPSYHILSILSRFCGFKDWDDFIKSYELGSATSSNSGFLSSNSVESINLKVGDLLIIDWLPNKGCTLQWDGKQFHVLQTHNIKLREGDTFEANLFCIGEPFYATSVIRDGQQLPAYCGARHKGVQSIKIIPA